MAKEKKRIEVSTPNPYLYEIISIMLILLGLITFSELGVVGIGLKNILKILFGDFYFVFLMFIIITGMYTLVKHEWIDFTSIRINGCILFFISLVSLSHFGFYEILGISSSKILVETFNTYSSVLKGNITISSYGGGLVGALGLQLLIYLFNRVGTIIILVVLMLLSCSFMTTITYKNFMYYIELIYKYFRNFFGSFGKYFKNIKIPTRESKKKNYNLINLNLLEDCDNKANEAISYKVASEQKNQLVGYLINQGNMISSSKVEVGYNASKFNIVGNFKEINEMQISSILHSSIIVYNNNNFLEIECINKIKRLLTLKFLLLQDKPYIPLGCNLSCNIVRFDCLTNKNILVAGGYDSGVRTFIKSFIVSNILCYKNNFSLVLLDLKGEFSELKYLPNLFLHYQHKIDSLSYVFDEVAQELEKRMQILNDHNCNDYQNFNNLYEYKINPMYVVINSLENLKNSNYNYESKLLYFLKFGYKVGISFIITNRNFGVLKSVISSCNTKIVYKCYSMDHSYEIVGNKNACNLDKKGDAIYLVDNKASRISTGYISNSDYEKVINKFII